MPVLDVLNDPFDLLEVLMVMPYLRPFDDLEFQTIGEVVDFVSQTLEVCSSANDSILQLRSTTHYAGIIFYPSPRCYTAVCIRK